MTADGDWQGLAGLSATQREELAAGIVPRVVGHLEACLNTTLEQWEQGATWREEQGEALEWAAQLRAYATPILQEFRDALAGDLRNPEYPPHYDFSGIAFAGGDSGLHILDDYQSSRRSLRHQLEGSVRENNRYSYFMLVQAAREDRRFEHPNWAPWSPLHWYERLIEAAERYFGRTALTLDLMQGYLRCLRDSGAPMMAFVVETVDACGLVTEEPEAGTAAGGARERESSASWQAYPAAAASRSEVRPPDADLGPLSARGGPEMPSPEDAPEAWARWAAELARATGSGPRSSVAGGAPAGSGPDGDAGAGDASGNAPAAAEQARSQEDLTPFILDLLQGMFDHIFRQVGFNPRVRAEIADMQFALARVVIRDLSFFRDRSHPLRLWIGSVINTGIRVSPEADDAEGDGGEEGVNAYLQRIRDSVERLRHEADSMDREGARALLEDWLAAIEEEDARWHRRQEPRTEAFEAEERAARARRSLTVCVLETGASLPQTAADSVEAAWEDLLAADGGEDEEVSRAIRGVVEAICRGATPAEIQPRVAELKAAGEQAGVEAERLRRVVEQLGRAHLARMRATADAEAFDPQERIRHRRHLRYEDDDPELVTDLDDAWVFEASRARVGDWYEMVDRTTGEARRMALVWRGEATRRFLFVSLDGVSARRHSLQGVAQELREGRMRILPQDNPLDAMIR
ncbi:DUF1631 family protein [Thioalkalivibrio sp. ALE11]|uniref:DUF1631 family protein n=1 Tax=Thioalkalivibrio sp. ALE11 TaxID=1265494 RepID=UPI00035E2552|nr:DUF1631 family protein [Thioalkalivibrio sp. ALE11]